MARPMKKRRVCSLPEDSRFGSLDRTFTAEDKLNMTVDEYETIRLIDLEGFTQEECAQQMGIARTTVQGIYVAARRKLAESLVNGRVLIIEGGKYQLCDDFGPDCGRACRRHGRGGVRGPRDGRGHGPRDGRGRFGQRV
ncbi:MAG: DUF134 domain-containing protein [Fastidiosipila sp.]|nr:DUF134 domain-containing protein [Fastidiosipila sp.]